MPSPEYGTSGTSTPLAPQALFTYRGVEVHVQPDGLIDAKDMHRAAGSPKGKAPYLWLRWQPAQDLIASLRKPADTQVLAASPVANKDSKCSPQNILRVEPGRSGGTWLCRELAVAYAAYLDADFHVFVLRVFLAAGDGRLVPASAPALDLAPLLAKMESLSALEAKLDAQAAALDAMRHELGEVVRPAHIRKTTRALHQKVALAKQGRRCPCCHDHPVVVIGVVGRPEWVNGYCVQRYRGVRFSRPRETWPVCKQCRGLLRDVEFHRSKRDHFAAYQESLLEWLTEKHPDFFRVA